ncbi:uncharacterized protein ARMOST_16449 [Armillaria ostoyae]|uniref:F-box domain-containing protein n=1 Tax=Armillaria ostoyae TaxID=47428 RepID=A0A284RW90_ARMOS|nr:uncharacterized protein ARMOST_16449 [Armillaria ostoyae]
MSCLTCSNCGFVNLLPPEPHVQQNLNAIQSSDDLVSQLLRGSRPLLDADHTFIDAAIAKLERLRCLYDDQLQGIQTRRGPVLKSLENHRSVYAPIRRLPRDILIEIFHSVCDYWKREGEEAEWRLRKQYHSLNVSGPLWVLGRVCGLWRHVLHTSPMSWARNLSMTYPFSKNAREILQTYLVHTGEHPLCIRVNLPHYTETGGDEIIALLVQSYYRWRNVRIHIPLSHVHHLEAISLPLPALQTIEIDVEYESTLAATNSRFHLDMCLNAPQLWQAALPRQGIFQVRLPPTITHYSGFITRAEDLQLLSQLHNLNMCHLHSTRMKSASLEGPVVMPQLCRLYIGELDIINCLTTPMLKHLTLTRDPRLRYQPSGDAECIDLFLRRSGCHLESLSLDEDLARRKSLDSITELLSSEACSTISHFKSKLDLYDLWRILAPSDVLPNLRHLVMCLLMPTPRIEWEEMPPLIRSRRDAGVLKTVELQFEDDEDLQMIADEDESWDPPFEYEIKKDIRALTGDNLEMWVAKWNSPNWEHKDIFT